MEPSLIELNRFWRDTRVTPKWDSRSFAAPCTLFDEPETLRRFGYHRTASFAEHDCVFALGRPGAGKSAELERINQGKVEGFGDEPIILIRCKEAGLDLFPEIERDSKWHAANQQEKPVRLIIDGLDEGFLRKPAYFHRLKRTLQLIRSRRSDIKLILACRPAEWDPEFGRDVHAMWLSAGEPAVFSLEPLTQIDQIALVKHWGEANPSKFFEWIASNRFREFAAWPRMLEWLVKEYRDGRGAKLTFTTLCKRRVSRSFGEDRRLVEANRSNRTEEWSHAITLVAATLVYCGMKGFALSAGEPDCLTLDDLLANGDQIEIPGHPRLTRETIIEAVRYSHLIEQIGAYYRFGNQSDLEFLAATTLASFDERQLSELFGCPDPDGRWRVFPQLATTAANLASLSPSFFRYLLKNDPRVLMRMDFASASDEDKKAAIDAMLRADGATGWTGGHDKHSLFSTLRYDGIEDRLRPWVLGKKKPEVARELAFDIATACFGGRFWLEFERAASQGDEFARQWLPSVVLRFGGNWPEEKLQEWAVTEDSDLAGAALEALLNRGSKVRDLMKFLRIPRSDSVSLYHFFIRRICHECTADDVPAALGVIISWPSGGDIYGLGGDLVLSLLSKGISEIHRIDVRKAVTSFLIKRGEENDLAFEANLDKVGLDNTEKRRALFIALAEDWPDDSPSELRPHIFLLPGGDYAWLLGQVALATGDVGRVLSNYASSLCWQFDESVREPFERAYAESPEFRAMLPKAGPEGIFATLQRLRSEARAKHDEKMAEIRKKREAAPFDARKLLVAALEKCRTGNAAAWTTLCYALSLPESDRDRLRFYSHSDPRQLAGWQELPEDVRAEFVKFARAFLLHVSIPIPEENSIPSEFEGLVYALSLLADDFAADSELCDAIQPAWPLALMNRSGSNDQPLAKPLAALTKAAPSVVAAACERNFQKRWEDNAAIFYGLLDAAWCGETQQALVGVLSQEPIQPETYTSGLAILAKHDAGAARELAERRLDDLAPRPEDSPARRAAIAACIFVIVDLWERAWPHFIPDLPSARQLLLEYSGWLRCNDEDKILDQMPDRLLAALYQVMIEAFPISECPERIGHYTPNAIDDAYSLRSRLRGILESRGAHRELRQVFARCAENRDQWWAKAFVDQAISAAHSGLRVPPSASDFIRFLATEGGTFVSDNGSLQRAVCESLRRFEVNLKPDGLHALWDWKNGTGAPRPEDALQIEIKQHLKQDFMKRQIIVNREVKVIREHPDIRVQAGPYAVTVEVKLGHSKDRDRPLREAMRTQLRTYLENQNETHGIYVVGWYFCPAFHPGGLPDMKTLSAANQYFTRQARKVSDEKIKIAATVIDCRWPVSVANRSGVKKTVAQTKKSGASTRPSRSGC